MNLKYFEDVEDAQNFEPFPLIFSRGSVAYEGNLAPLASNQPSFIEGSKGVYGLGMYGQYTNLLPSGVSQDFNEAWTSGTLNGTYTINIKSGGGSITLSGGATGTVTSGNSLTFTVTSNTVTFTPTGSCLNTILVNTAYALPWVLGGTTRQPDSCYIPVNEVKKFLKLNEGCIESLVYVNNVLSTTPLSENKVLFGQGTGGNNGTLLIWKERDNSSYTLGINGGTGNWVVVAPNPSINGLMTPFTIMWNSLKAGLMINSQFSEGSPTSFPQIYSTFRIGSRGADWFMSSHIPQLVFSKYRTREEIANRQKFAQANGYYPIDDKVTGFLDLESGLRAYRRVNL